MPTLYNYLSMIAVGAFWGCTNPLLRQGAVQATNQNHIATTTSTTNSSHNNNDSNNASNNNPPSIITGSLQSLLKFRQWQVWLPYVVNQLGSALFYVTLGNSELSLAVPICNGLALVFSILTSFVIGGERPDDNPLQTVLGSALVVLGVALCVLSSSSEENGNSTDNMTMEQQ
mmetsp:Transcript_25561/g.70580  ORF Transcript_25561/g.70580 Transcript_25561/m.70580 type:complete len:173 (+) Transcript_25561:231-749(+)